MAARERVFTPLNKRVAVERFETKDRTAGGLYIPEAAKEVPIGGRVISVASDCTNGVKIGDTVCFGKFAGQEIAIDGKTMLLVKEEDLLGVYN